MCRFTHPLAAIGTMSWPEFRLQRRANAVLPNTPSPLWNHPLAETAESEASVGRDRRKLFRLQLAVTNRVMNWRNGLGAEGIGRSREASNCRDIRVGSALTIGIKEVRLMAGNNNRFRTVSNHPMAARFWKHQLAKTAIGWVE